MKKKLQAIYIKSDTTCRELSKVALIQLILKIVYFYEEPINGETIKSEVNGILGANLSMDRINDAISLLLSEGKIISKDDGYGITVSRRKKFDSAFQEHAERQERIIDKYFSTTKSDKAAVQNWFENVTIEFFMEFRSEWIAQKAYNIRPSDAYDGLRNIVKKETYRDEAIKTEDKEWLIGQYIKFFKSSDEDLSSVYWDYGTCAYSSSLITATNAANQVTLDTIRKSKFIVDTNILMYLSLEAGKYYESYNALGKIFSELNIKPGYFYISRDEYIRSTSFKKELILNIINKYDNSVIDQLDDDFIKTAKARNCVTEDDFIQFFDTLLDPPSEFSEGVELELFDDQNINSEIEKGTNDEDLMTLLNDLFKNRHHNNGEVPDQNSNVEEKGKGRKPLMHDAGLIRGAEYLRSKENCFILTRESSVKQYGILKAVRDEPSISIGLDTLIGLLAIDSGGLEIDPSNIKPLFAKIIKLALLPERGTFRLEDLVGMYDIEQNIANLPNDDVISMAKEMHKFQLSGMSDSKITVEIQRQFQHAKLSLKNDLNEVNAELAAEKRQKEFYKTSNEKAEDALRETLTEELIRKHNKWYKNQRIQYFLYLPLITTILTLLIIYQNKQTGPVVWLSNVIGFFVNVAAWFFINFFIMLPKITRTYQARINDIKQEVLDKIRNLQ